MTMVETRRRAAAWTHIRWCTWPRSSITTAVCSAIEEFEVTRAGYAKLLEWMSGFGVLDPRWDRGHRLVWS